MYARIASFEGRDASLTDQLIQRVRDAGPSSVPDAKGFLGLFDRNSGRSIVITLWESSDALRQSEQQANKLREQAAKSGSQRIGNVDRYEVAVAQQLSGVHA